MNKKQKNLIIAFFIWVIILPIIAIPAKLGLDLVEFFRDVSNGIIMFFGGLGFSIIWYLIETKEIKIKK